jgi:hypothetical protein
MATDTEIAARPFEVNEMELRGETALLAHCARLRLSPRRVQAIKDILGAGVDWDSLLKTAAWHRLTPLVSHHLRSPGLAPLVPPAMIAKLSGVHYQSLARNMLLQDELCRLLAAFNKAGVPVIILKGSALLDSVYKDISLRPMSDLDLLVRPGDLGRVEALVLGMDYAYLTKKGNGAVSEGNRHLPNLGNQKKGIFIEVHQHIVSTGDPGYFDISEFWARARPVRKQNTDALAFAPEDMLLHLAIKFLSDRRFQSQAALGQLCDISETIKHHADSLDWELIVSVSTSKGFAAGMHSVLYGCQRVLGTAVPAGFMQRLCSERFDPGVADLFLRRRVLDTRPWLAHALVGHRKPYSRRRALGGMFGRFTSLLTEALLRNGHQGSRGFLSLKRVKAVIPRVFRAALRPSRIKEDLLLDRWLHDLYR